MICFYKEAILDTYSYLKAKEVDTMS